MLLDSPHGHGDDLDALHGPDLEHDLHDFCGRRGLHGHGPYGFDLKFEWSEATTNIQNLILYNIAMYYFILYTWILYYIQISFKSSKFWPRASVDLSTCFDSWVKIARPEMQAGTTAKSPRDHFEAYLRKFLQIREIAIGFRCSVSPLRAGEHMEFPQTAGCSRPKPISQRSHTLPLDRDPKRKVWWQNPWKIMWNLEILIEMARNDWYAWDCFRKPESLWGCEVGLNLTSGSRSWPCLVPLWVGWAAKTWRSLRLGTCVSFGTLGGEA